MGNLGNKRCAIPSLRAVVLACAVLISGCTSSSTPTETPVESGSTIIVEDGEGGKVAVNVTNETGAVVGQVLTDAGFGLPNSRVTVIGAEHGSTTNQTGWFQITNVKPGKRLIRAEHENYRTAENEIDVKGGSVLSVTITLVPPVDSEAGYRPHIHDYWAGRTEVLVIDANFPYQPNKYSPPTQQYAMANQIGGNAARGACATGTTKSENQSPFSFQDPAQLVWPGTSQIQVKISWDAASYIGESVGLVWRSPSMKSYGWSPPIKNGDTFEIPVTSSDWDNAHQPFSLWEFSLCVKGKGEQTAASVTVGRVFLGQYHVTMTLHGSSPSLLDPPHPRFWANGSAIVVLEGQRNISCPASAVPCTAYGILGKSFWLEHFQFRPTFLVPPGATHLTVWLNWTYGTVLNNVPLGLAVSPANVPPTAKGDLLQYKPIANAQTISNSKLFEVVLAPAETDSPYQQRSNWVFLWGHEGKETADSYSQYCGCELKVSIVVQAHNREI